MEKNTSIDAAKYKLYTWKNLTYLHWIINPGAAVGDLLLGTRIPKVLLEEKYSEKTLMERTFVPCPHCHVVHNQMLWSSIFGTHAQNWYGLYCPSCGGIIPCHRNLFSGVVLAITFPIWGWFRHRLKANWLAKQPARCANANPLDIAPKHFKINPWKLSLYFGSAMLIFFVLMDGWKFGWSHALQSLWWLTMLWMIGGLAFGFTFKYLMEKKGKPLTHPVK
jgi:hypothetical protein